MVDNAGAAAVEEARRAVDWKDLEMDRWAALRKMRRPRSDEVAIVDDLRLRLKKMKKESVA